MEASEATSIRRPRLIRVHRRQGQRVYEYHASTDNPHFILPSRREWGELGVGGRGLKGEPTPAGEDSTRSGVDHGSQLNYFVQDLESRSKIERPSQHRLSSSQKNKQKAAQTTQHIKLM